MKTLDIQYRQVQSINSDLGMPDIADVLMEDSEINLKNNPDIKKYYLGEKITAHRREINP